MQLETDKDIIGMEIVTSSGGWGWSVSEEQGGFGLSGLAARFITSGYAAWMKMGIISASEPGWP